MLHCILPVPFILLILSSFLYWQEEVSCCRPHEHPLSFSVPFVETFWPCFVDCIPEEFLCSSLFIELPWLILPVVEDMVFLSVQFFLSAISLYCEVLDCWEIMLDPFSPLLLPFVNSCLGTLELTNHGPGPLELIYSEVRGLHIPILCAEVATLLISYHQLVGIHT